MFSLSSNSSVPVSGITEPNWTPEKRLCLRYVAFFLNIHLGHLPCQREEEAFSEIVDLENTKTCSVLKKFPYWMRGAVGGSLGSTPVVCGGDWIDKCYTYIKNQSTIEGYGNSGNGLETNYTP